VTFQAFLVTDYMTTFYGVIYDDRRMTWDVPMSRISGANDFYPARVGFYCGADNKYTYDYSQLPYSLVATHKNKIEKIDNVFQTYTSHDVNFATLIQQRKTAGGITWSDDVSASVPSYSSRGVHIYVLAHVTSHPVLECKAWMTSDTPISNVSLAHVCPSALTQMVGGQRFTQKAVTTLDGTQVTCYEQRPQGNEILPCCYNGDVFVGPLQFRNMDGANIYR